MPYKITADDLLGMANRVENAVGRYHSLVGTMHKLAGELDGMWDADAVPKLTTELQNDCVLNKSLPELLETHIHELRFSADLLNKPEPYWDCPKLY